MNALRTARLELRPMDEGDLDALVELDGFAEVRDAVDPFNEHIPDDPVARREYERRFLHPAGYLAAIELATGRFLGWVQLVADRDREAEAGGAGEAGRAGGGGAAEAGGAGAGGASRAVGATGPAGTGAQARAPTEVEIGYRLRPDAWGRGFATEGAAALLADALSRPDVMRVYAHALVSNPGSIRVMEKIGMTYAGLWTYMGLEGAEYEALPGTGPRSAPAKRP
jgi:RimJ/RimL family protein N-acetyltransferase